MAALPKTTWPVIHASAVRCVYAKATMGMRTTTATAPASSHRVSTPAVRRPDSPDSPGAAISSDTACAARMSSPKMLNSPVSAAATPYTTHHRPPSSMALSRR